MRNVFATWVVFSRVHELYFRLMFLYSFQDTVQGSRKVGMNSTKHYRKYKRTNQNYLYSELKERTTMARVKGNTSSGGGREMKPAISPEVRENQLISLAVDLAEKQLREGTASSQVITHYLKLGSTKEKIEKEILEKQKELLESKTQSIQSAARVEELYSEALNAMRRYSGSVKND